MSDYVPDDQAVREAYRFHVRTIDNAKYAKSGRAPMTDEEIRAEFDRFLAKVKADAWLEGLGAGADRWMDHREFGDPPVNPYRIEGDSNE